MKKKMTKVLATVMCVMTAVAFMPAAAFAADSQAISVTVNGCDKGEMLGVKTVSVSPAAFDEAAAGADACDYVTFADVITVYSNAVKKESAFMTGQYGLSLTKLFGDDSGSFGYYIDDASAWSAADEVKDGQFVTAFVYQDQMGWSDMYAYFDRKALSTESGRTETLKLTAVADWGATVKEYEGAQVKSGNKVLGTTDEKGEVAVKFSKAGTYTVTAVGAGEDILVPPACVITVREAAVKKPVKPAFRLTAGKKQFTVKMSKSAAKYGATGFQVAYKKASAGKWKSIKTTSVKKTISKLSKKTKYSVKLRSYKKVSGKYYYSSYTAVKSIKTK